MSQSPPKGPFGLLALSGKVSMTSVNTHPSESLIVITQKTYKPRKKIIHKKLTFMDVPEAAHDGQKVFDAFVITGKLPMTE
jgi:hypothetical protein